MIGTSHSIADRDLRQRDIVPPQHLAEVHAVIIGVGAVGRQAALQSAAVGIPRLTLIDFDTVEAANLAPQGYYPSDLGRLKVDATAEVCRRINPEVRVDVLAERFRRSTARDMPTGGRSAIFSCVDSIDARRLIWESVRSRADFFCDARMSAEVLRVLASDRPAADERYAATLFAPERAFVGSCTAKSTIYTASIAAGLMLAAFAKWLRGMPVEADVTLNLLAGEMTIDESVRQTAPTCSRESTQTPLRPG